MLAVQVKKLAAECGFELCGVTPALPVEELDYYSEWVANGYAGQMRYLTDHRADVREDPRNLMPSARSVIVVGKLYDTPRPYSTEWDAEGRAWISRYAWGEDYHHVMRHGLKQLAERLKEHAGAFEWKICVDTAPLVERAYGRHAGLGWIAKNTCLISEQFGSWFFLGELLTSLTLEPDAPPPDRCGTCRACIDACPTRAIVPTGRSQPAWALDARLCISYFTIELRDQIPESHRENIGTHVFGCDICQDVCPWNRRRTFSPEPAFEAREFAPDLEELCSLSEEEFLRRFRLSPVMRAGYAGFLRNVAVAMGNAGSGKFVAPLAVLAGSPYPLVAEAARWALERLQKTPEKHPVQLI